MANLTGQGPIGAPGGTSQAFTTPYPLRPKTRMSDVDGNIYQFVVYNAAVYSGLPVQINPDGTADVVGTTGRGPIGIVQAPASSDEAGWVLIYGRTLMQIGAAGTSPSDAANGPTTVQTSALTQFMLATSATSLNVFALATDPSSLDGRYLIKGIWVARDATIGADVTAVTAATSHVGHQVAVFLNFPQIEYQGGLIGVAT